MLRKILLTLSLLTLGLVGPVPVAHSQTVNSFDGVNLHWQPQGSPEILTPMGVPPACQDTSGSTTLQTCNTPSQFQPTIGISLTYTPSVNNTGTISLLVNGYGPYPFKKCTSTNLVLNDLVAGVPSIITFTGTAWIVYNTTRGCGSGGGGGGGFVAGGDLTGTSTNQTVVGINGSNLAAFSSGFLFITTGTGAPNTVGTTGSGNVVLASSPTLITPNLGTPSTLILTNAQSLPCTALPAFTGDVTKSSGSCATVVTSINGTSFTGTNGHLVSFGASNIPADSGLVATNVVLAVLSGAGVAHFPGSSQTVTSSPVTPSDASGNTSGSGNFCLVTSCTMVTPALGTPASATLTNATGYLWSNLAAPGGSLSLSMGSNASTFNTTSAVSQFFAWKNTTAATSGTSQASPVLALCGRAWVGSDTEDCLTLQNTPGNGSNAAITQTFGHTGSSTGVVTAQFSGPVAAGSSSNAGLISLPGNTSNPSIPSNVFGILGPTSASFTSYAIQMSATAPSGTQVLQCGTPSSNISTCSWATASGGSAFPVTVTGGVSGAVPCFTSTTVEAAGTLLASGGIVLGGGSGACPTTNTQLTFSAPTLTVGLAGTSSGILALTGSTSGSATFTAPAVAGTATNAVVSSNVLNAPAFIANGSTAGFIDFPQGSTSASVGPCNAATSVCLMAPTSVTYQLRIFAGAPATGFPLYTNSSGTMTETITPVEGTISTGPALFGSSAVNTVVAQTKAVAAGHFTNLVTTSSLGGSCTTAPTFNVFDGTSNTGTAILSTSTTQTKGTSTTQSQTLTFAAGDLIGIYISIAGATCTTDTWVVSAEYSTP